MNDILEDKSYTDQEGNEYIVIATKLDKDQYNLFSRIAERLHQSKYGIIQQAISSYIALMSLRRRISDELQKICTLFNLGIHYERRFNLTNPSLDASVQGAIYFLGNSHMRGTQPVYVDAPFMGEAEQTENVQEMFDLFLDAANHELFCKMCSERDRRSVGSNWYLLITLLQECEGIEDIEEIERTFADDRRSDWGKQPNESGPYRRTMNNSMESYERRLANFNNHQTELDLDIE